METVTFQGIFDEVKTKTKTSKSGDKVFTTIKPETMYSSIDEIKYISSGVRGAMEDLYIDKFDFIPECFPQELTISNENDDCVEVQIEEVKCKYKVSKEGDIIITFEIKIDGDCKEVNNFRGYLVNFNG